MAKIYKLFTKYLTTFPMRNKGINLLMKTDLKGGIPYT